MTNITELRPPPALNVLSPFTKLEMAYKAWMLRTKVEPDFLVVRGDELGTLRKELAFALKQEMPCIDDMRKQMGRGELRIGSFIVLTGPEYGAGKWA